MKRLNKIWLVGVIVVLIACESARADLTDGLVAHWKLDEVEGDIAYDSAGDNHGTLFNGPLWTTGLIDGALEFDGEDDRVKIPSNTISGTELTLNLWVKTNDSTYSLVSGANSEFNNEYLLYVQADHGSKLEIYYHDDVGAGGDNFYLTNIKINDNLWHMLTVVTKLDETEIYVDGLLKETADYGSVSNFNIEGLWIAGEQDCVNGCWNTSQQLNGTIDDVRIYNRALSAEEIEQLYLDSFGQFISLEIVGPNTVAENFQAQYKAIAHFEKADVDVTGSALWSVDDEAVATIDENGLLTTVEINQPQKDIVISAEYTKGQITAADDKNVTVFAICPSGTALEFDGMDDYVEIPWDESFANVADNFTILLWAQPLSTHQIDPESDSGTRGTSGQKYAIWPTQGDNCWGGGHAGAGISIGTNGISVYEHAAYYMPGILVWSGSVSGVTHVAVVYNDKQPRLYIDGELKKTGLQSSKTVHIWSNYIGGHSYGYFNGLIDDVRIYDRALSAEEIQANMHTKLTGDEPNLVSYWDFDEGEGQVAWDISGNGNNGTLGDDPNNPDSADPMWVESGAPIGICTPCEFVERELISAYEYKMNIMQELQAAMDKEENALAVLLELFRNSNRNRGRNRNRDFCGLSRRDVIGARINISQSIDREETGKKELEKSIERLKAALMYLGIDDQE